MGTISFDAYKDTYRDEVQKAIAFAGQDVDFFTRAKVNHLLDLSRRLLGEPKNLRVLDVGCGVGLTDRYLLPHFRALSGVDISGESVQVAARNNPDGRYQTYAGDVLPFRDDTFDLVFAICVMHHVPPAGWPPFVQEMQRVVRPGGLTVVFEHNPNNPLTRRAVNRCPFDADAVLLRLGTTKRLFRQAGLELLERRYILFFPWEAPVFKQLERGLGGLPLGGQYYVVGRKPFTAGEAAPRWAA